MMHQKSFLQRLKNALQFVYPHKYLFASVLGLTLIGSLLSLAPPYLMKIFFDDVLLNKRMNLFYILAFAFAGVFVLTKAIGFLKSILSTKFSQKINLDVRTKLFSHLNSLDRGFFQEHKRGDIITRFEKDATSVLAFINIIFNSGLISIINSISLIAVSATLSWKTTLMALAAFPIYFVSERYFVRIAKKRTKKIVHKSSDILSFLNEKLSMIKTTQLFTREDIEKESYSKKNKIRDKEKMKLTVLNNFSGSINSLILYVPSYLVIIFGGYSVIAGAMTIGTLVALRSYIQTLFGPLSTLTTIYRDTQINSVSLDRIFEILDRKPNISSEKNSELPEIKGRVDFNKVSFSYEKGIPVLNKISFSASKGETIGIMGCSGEGKSTICDLLCRFYDPQKGDILVDGHNIRKMDLNSLRKKISIVSQDLLLADATVGENIKFGDPKATKADVVTAAKGADAHKFIAKLPRGYNTKVNECGDRLSGGQKQRIAIARCIIRNPQIIIFDEATSALDPQSELNIRETIKYRFKDKTCIVISHRISTLLDCDRVLMLKNGAICEEGSLAYLLSRKGLFRKFYDSQTTPIGKITV